MNQNIIRYYSLVIIKVAIYSSKFIIKEFEEMINRSKLKKIRL